MPAFAAIGQVSLCVFTLKAAQPLGPLAYSSPDGLVYDQDELLGVLEIKCPFSARKWLPLKQLKSYRHFLARRLVETYPWRETRTTFKCKASLPSPMHSGVIFVCTHHMGFFLNGSHLMSHSGSVVCKLDDFYYKFIVPANSNDTVPCLRSRWMNFEYSSHIQLLYII